MLNLTQHNATTEQVAAGVVEPQDKGAVRGLLTFSSLPTPGEIKDRAANLAAIAAQSGQSSAMIGGAPFLMSELEIALLIVGVKPVYAFSVRESVDQAQEDGSVRKVATFRHLGFVEVTK